MSTELFKAIDAHDAERVVSLLSQGADPNEPLAESPHWLPLEAVIEEAAEHDCPMEVAMEIIRQLLQHGADVNAWDDQHTATPLLAAVNWGNEEAIRLFVKAGADPNVVSDEGLSPLRWAVEEDDLEMAALFLRHGADKTINAFGGFCGWTPLGMAASKLNLPMIELLLDAGADPEALDEDGRTARDHLPPRDKSDPEVWDKALERLSLRTA
jgi:uncharacterized protein